MRIEEAGGIEFEEAREEPAERIVGARLDLAPGGAEELRQLVRAQREARDDAPAAAATTLECPEEIRMRALIHGERAAVGSHHFRFQQPRGRGAEGLGEAAEAAALHQPRNTDAGAAAALHIVARACGHGAVEIDLHIAPEPLDTAATPAILPAQPCGTKASCSVTSCSARVHTSSESGALEVP